MPTAKMTKMKQVNPCDKPEKHKHKWRHVGYGCHWCIRCGWLRTSGAYDKYSYHVPTARFTDKGEL